MNDLEPPKNNISYDTPIKNYWSCFVEILRITRIELDRDASEWKLPFSDYSDLSIFNPESFGRILLRLQNLYEGVAQKYCKSDELRYKLKSAVERSSQCGFHLETDDGFIYPFTKILEHK